MKTFTEQEYLSALRIIRAEFDRLRACANQPLDQTFGPQEAGTFRDTDT